jgi:branched-chain amino acid transport system ATP-binding protein
VLEVADLEVSYGAVKAVRGVSFGVAEGEIVLLMGPNGAGKSTIAMTIAGLLRPDAGTIRFDGAPLHGPAHQVLRRGVSLVAEGRRIFPLQTVEDNLLLGAFVHRLDRRGVAGALREIHELFPVLAAKRRALASTLSGGEQQMLAVGQALMARPRLLICDEPSLGLSPRVAQELFKRLERINQEGMSVLLLEQRVSLALPIARRGCVIEAGRIVLEGTRSALELESRVIESYLGGVPDGAPRAR